MGKIATTSRHRGGGRNVIPALIDSDYRRKGQVLGGPSKRAYYGSPEGPIGPIGVALALHRWLWRETGMTAQAFGTALETHLRSELDRLPDNLGSDHLRGWVQASRPVALPDPKYVGPVLRALQKLAAENHLQGEIVAALDQSWKLPSALLTQLPSAHASESRGPYLDAIDPLLRLKAPLRESHHEDLVSELGDLLTGKIGRSKIIWLYGSPYVGKRRILMRLIAENLADDESIDLANGERSQLFARADCSLIERVIFEIAIFLQIKDFPVDQLDWLLDRIQEAASKTTATFILANVPSTDDPLQNLFRNESLQRLLEALFMNGSGNRILVTSTDSASQNPYLNGPFYERFVPCEVASTFANRHGILLPKEVNAAKPLDGPLSGLLETVLNLYETKLEIHPAIIKALKFWGDLPDRSGNWDWSTRDDLRDISAIVYDRLTDQQQRQILRVMANSDDGVRLSSLFLLRKEECTSACKDIESNVEELLRRLPMLCTKRNAGPWPYEDPPDQMDEEPEVEFLSPYRQIFETMLLGHEPDVFRRESLRVAWGIRERARWSRLASGGSNMRPPPTVARIAQSLLRALVALDPKSLGAGVKKHADTGAGLRAKACTLGIPLFAIEEMVFSGRLDVQRDLPDVFRFLYYELFRNDLDRGHQLSRDYQQDDVRLSVLLGFCNVGWPVYVGNHELSSSFRSWDIVQKLLPPRECAELLVSIVISAGRAAAWPVLEAAIERAEHLVSQRKIPLVAIQRVHRRQIDFAILTCGSKQKQKDCSRHPKFHSLVDIEHYVLGLRDRYDQVRAGHDSAEICAARVKLMAALGEIYTMMGRLRKALDEFEKATRLETNMLADHGNSHGAWPRSSLSGQAARRYMWLLCELASRSGDEAKRRSYVELCRALQDMNLKRSAGHKGEIPALLLGEAVLAALEGHWIRAEKLLLDRLSAGAHLVTTSPLSRVYIDSLSVRIIFDLLKAADKSICMRRSELLQRAKVLIERLLRITHPAAQNIPIFYAESLLLAARLKVEHQIGVESTIEDVTLGPLHMLASAAQIGARTGYMLRKAENRRVRNILESQAKADVTGTSLATV
jgi:hypothetical protein